MGAVCARARCVGECGSEEVQGGECGSREGLELVFLREFTDRSGVDEGYGLLFYVLGGIKGKGQDRG